MRLIDADKFEAFSGNLPASDDPSYIDGYIHGMERVLEEIDAAKTADAEPVVHGQWQRVSPDTDSVECSVCRYCIWSEELQTPRCPWCGAKLDNWRSHDST